MTRTFDRLPEFDERSRAFPVRALTGDRPRRSYTWRVGVWLDQGQEGACVGFSWAHELAARPVVVPNVSNAMAMSIYRIARTLDDYPGEDYEGTSVLGGAKAVTGMHRLKEYRWAFGEEDACLAVGYHGPGILGTNWYEGMMDPDEDGFLRPTGTIVGGHAICVNGYSVKRNAYKVHNSWGIGWGILGEAWINREDMATLLANDGEFCVPVVRQ